ncbi:MAG: serine/threonine-protein kinase [Proteobacteria bacterium]|nr:serine/threonine-protein kinase [Pseudomonadota bacterium]
MGFSLEVGAVVAGKYRLEREIGSGGMGVVYAATNVHLEQRVALKFLHGDAKTPETVQRFWREARSAAKIQSEHVARVLDIGELESTPYIVMEYLEGDDLEHVVAAQGPLAVSDAIRYLLEACEALVEVYVHDMVHRDIKPANLFLAARADGSSTVKLLDFGISKQTWETEGREGRDGGRSKLTQTSTVIGSPRYMSPEQLRSSRDVDARSDVWALGVTLFELLGGDSPFASGTMPEVCASILKDAPTSLVGLRPDIPAELEAVIHRCLAKEPESRWQNVAELAVALAPFGPVGSTSRSVERVAGVLHQAVPSVTIPPPFTHAPGSAPTESAVPAPVRDEAYYLDQIGDLAHVPHPIVALSKLPSLTSLNLDHRAGFLFSMMDGISSLDDLLVVSGMARLETLKLIFDLINHRLIRIAPPN